MDKKFEYKVIGWTDYSDRRFKDYDQSREAYNALIEDIRKNGYKFGGDAHEDYVPVFNDGTAARFSWRGWGGVMADAWQPDNHDPYKYSLYYMNMNIEPAEIKYPQEGVNFELLEAPVHKLPLYDREFIDERYLCEKSLFIELPSDELKDIKAGDFVDFYDPEDGSSLMGKIYVMNVYSTVTVEEMLEKMRENLPEFEDVGEELGFEQKLPKEKIAELIRKKISSEAEKERGLWGMEVMYV